MSSNISIIIPTLLSQPKKLDDCLGSLAHQRLSAQFDVWVVANTSTTQMNLVRSKLSSTAHKKLKVQWLCLGSNRGFPAAVNAGIAASSSKYVVLLNDDTETKPDWLKQLIETHQSSQAEMVASSIYRTDKKTLDSQGFTFWWRGKAPVLPQSQTPNDSWLLHPELLPNQTDLSEPFGPDAAAAFYTREILEKIGGFKESFFAYLEDVDVALRARQQGARCVLAKRAVVFHHKHATSSQWSRFKVRLDAINWWRVVLHDYPTAAWYQFGWLIVVERFRNCAGYLKGG